MISLLKSVRNRVPFGGAGLAVIGALAGLGVAWAAYAMVGGGTPAAHTDLPPQAVAHLNFCTSAGPAVNPSEGAPVSTRRQRGYGRGTNACRRWRPQGE